MHNPCVLFRVRKTLNLHIIHCYTVLITFFTLKGTHLRFYFRFDILLLIKPSWYCIIQNVCMCRCKKKIKHLFTVLTKIQKNVVENYRFTVKCITHSQDWQLLSQRLVARSHSYYEREHLKWMQTVRSEN